MIAGSWRVAWYRFRVTFGSRWPGYVALVLLIGGLGGLAMATVAAARRTQSSFSSFLASTNPSDLVVGTSLYNPALANSTGDDTARIDAIARLPHVRAVESMAGFSSGPPTPPVCAQLQPQRRHRGQPRRPLPPSGSSDRVARSAAQPGSGRRVRHRRRDRAGAEAPRRPDRPVGLLHVEPGGPLEHLPDDHAVLRVNERLVGTVTFNNTVVQDDVDATNGSPTSLFTPALTRRLTQCCVTYTFSGLQLVHGNRNVPAVESELGRLLPSALPHDFTATALTEGKAVRALKPESIALGVFGGIAALAALLIAGQLIGRQLRLGADEAQTLRGAGRRPDDDPRRRAPWDRARGARRVAARPARRRGPLAAGPARSRARRVPDVGRGVRLDRARVRFRDSRSSA